MATQAQAQAQVHTTPVLLYLNASFEACLFGMLYIFFYCVTGTHHSTTQQTRIQTTTINNVNQTTGPDRITEKLNGKMNSRTRSDANKHRTRPDRTAPYRTGFGSYLLPVFAPNANLEVHHLAVVLPARRAGRHLGE